MNRKIVSLIAVVAVAVSAVAGVQLLGGRGPFVTGQAVSGTPSTPPSPSRQPKQGIAYYLVSDDPAVTETRAVRQAQAIGHLVAVCMDAARLPYVQAPPNESPAAGLDPVAFATQYGFGITTFPPGSRDSGGRDPNLDYAESLPTADQGRYRQALYGPNGCYQQASTRVDELRESRMLEFRPLLDELTRDIAVDGTITDSETAWRDCAAEAGLPVGRENLSTVVEGLFSARLVAILGPTLDRADFDKEALASLQDEERQLAVAIGGCDRLLIAKQVPVIAGLEAAWVAKYHAELVDLRADLLAADLELAGLASGTASSPLPS